MTTEDRSERDRMVSGELYLSADPELVDLRQRARLLLRAYEATAPTDTGLRRELLGRLFGRVGERAEIEPPFRCDYGWNIFAGDDLYMNFGCIVLDCAPVHFGDRVLVGPHVLISAASHPLDPEVRRSGREVARPIRIGADVWIGAGAIVCDGVAIGAGTTIGAGSVVTREIPARVVAAGNPCRVLRPV